MSSDEGVYKLQVIKEMNLAKDEHSNHFYFKHKLSNGQIRNVEVNSTPITFEGKKLLSSIVYFFRFSIRSRNKSPNCEN